MTLKVCGWSGPKTQQALINARAALDNFKPDGHVEWITDIYEMKRLGVVHTPAVVINDKVMVSGRVPSVHELTTWLEKELVEESAT